MLWCTGNWEKGYLSEAKAANGNSCRWQLSSEVKKMSCPISKRLLDELAKAAASETQGRATLDVRRECDAIRRLLVDHAKEHDCLWVRVSAFPKLQG